MKLRPVSEIKESLLNRKLILIDETGKPFLTKKAKDLVNKGYSFIVYGDSKEWTYMDFILPENGQMVDGKLTVGGVGIIQTPNWEE
jgi:hypothetical protein